MIDSERYKTFLQRFVAGMIDCIVFIPIVIADSYIFQEARSLTILIIWAVISFMSYSIYSTLMHAYYGQTIGKMLTGVKVLDVSETSVPGLKKAFLRDSVYSVLSLASLSWYILLLFQQGFTEPYVKFSIIDKISIIWVLSEFVTMLTNKRRRALHDFIAGTVVVNS